MRRSSPIPTLCFAVLAFLGQIPIDRADDAEIIDDEDSFAVELTAPDLYTRFSAASGADDAGDRRDGDGGLRFRSSSSLVIDGDVRTVAESDAAVMPWWLVELAPRDGLYTVRSVLVTLGAVDGGSGSDSLLVLVGNDTRTPPSHDGSGGGATWTECARGDRSLREQLLCCSSAVVGSAVAVLANSGPDGRAQPLSLNEVTVFGAARRCPPGSYGRRCERACESCSRAAGATCACDGLGCSVPCRGTCTTTAGGGSRLQPLDGCSLSTATTTAEEAATSLNAAAPRSRQEMISNRRTDAVSAREPHLGRPVGCAAYGRRLTSEREYVSIRHAYFDAPPIADPMAREAYLLVGNDSRLPAFAGSAHWVTCASFLEAPPGGGGSAFLLSCETPTLGRYAALHLKRRGTTELSYEVTAATLLLGTVVVVASADEPSAGGAVDLSFLGYYWMDERKYATYMLLAFPALFAIVMMAATFAIACVKRKKVVSDQVYFVNDMRPLLRRSDSQRQRSKA